MNVFSITVILIVSVLLLTGVSFIFMKIYGRGIFCGLKLTAVVTITNSDDAEAILYNITDNLCSDCECSLVKVIIVDGGMSIEQREICEKYCGKYSFFIMTVPEKLSEIIFDIQKKCKS